MDFDYSYLAISKRAPIPGSIIEVLGFEGVHHGDIVGSAESTHQIRGARWIRAVYVGPLKGDLVYRPLVGGQLGLRTRIVAPENVRVPKWQNL